MKRLPLSQGLYATVSDRDFGHLNRWKWTAWCGGKVHYASRKTSRATGQCNKFMHRVVADRKGLPAGRVDHVDGNGLNNCRSNLRCATQSQNGMNRRKPRTNQSGYKGVSHTINSARWRARIGAGGKEKQLGTFATPRQAAYAYDRAATKLHGRFVCVDAVTCKNPLTAANFSALLYLCTIVSTVLIVEKCFAAVVAYIIGGWIGTYVVVERRRDHRGN